MNDLTTVQNTDGHTPPPEDVDPLIQEAAVGALATKLCRAAFDAILNGELTTMSWLAASTGASATSTATPVTSLLTIPVLEYIMTIRLSTIQHEIP